MDNFEQNQNQNKTAPNPEPLQTSTSIPPEPKKSSSLSVIVFIIVVIVLLAGGLLVWGSKLTEEERGATENTVTTPEINTEKNMEVTEPTPVPGSEEISNDDDLDAIENEAKDTEIEGAGNFDYNFDTQN